MLYLTQVRSLVSRTASPQVGSVAAP
jgi:hypothetical protein